MKKTGYIILLIVILLQAGGILFIFNTQQLYVKYKMSEELKSNSAVLDKLIISLEKFESSRINTNEISFNGKLYDIKSATISGNNVELLVINDIEEEDIVDKIKKIINHSGLPDSKIPFHLQKIISLVYIPTLFNELNFIPLVSENIFQLLKPDCFSGYSAIVFLPPEFS